MQLKFNWELSDCDHIIEKTNGLRHLSHLADI